MSAAEAGGRRLHQPACQLAELVMRYPVLRHDLHSADSDGEGGDAGVGLGVGLEVAGGMGWGVGVRVKIGLRMGVSVGVGVMVGVGERWGPLTLLLFLSDRQERSS